MSAVRHTLDAAARKLTVVHALHVFLAAAAGSTVVWTVLVLLVGTSWGIFWVVVGCMLAVLVVGLASARRTVLDAARHVERSAGWEERLSTMVEVETSDPGNPFRGRLRVEVDRLLAETAPLTFIPWDVQRAVVLAVGSALVAVVVTVLVPDGVRGMLGASEASVRRERAAVILEGAVGRLEERAPEVPGVNEMRLELVGLLDDVRRKRNTEDIERKSADVLRKAGTDPAEGLRTEAGEIAEELGKSDALSAASDALRRMDAGDLADEVSKLSEKAPAMTPMERRAAVDVLAAAADAGRTPGLTEPLRRAAAALAATDIETFRRAMRDFAAAMQREGTRTTAETEALADVRNVLTRVAAVMSGRDDPGRTPPRRRADFFVEGGPSPQGSGGSGNLTVRGAPPDIQQVWEQSHAADVSLPKLDDVVRSGRIALERDTLDPEHREYVRKYFGVEDDNR